MHQKTCPDKHCENVYLSLDGVSQAKSSSVTLDIYSTSFKNCRIVYPLTIIRPLNRYPVGYREYLEPIINELHECHCKAKKFIADNPKRAIVREALNHASHYACEYCTAKAGRTKIQPKSDTDVQSIDNAITFLEQMSGSSKMCRSKDSHLRDLHDLKKKLNTSKNRTQLAWPHSSSKGPERSDIRTEAIVMQIEDGCVDPDIAKGIVGRSLFLDVGYFDFTEDIPA